MLAAGAQSPTPIPDKVWGNQKGSNQWNPPPNWDPRGTPSTGAILGFGAVGPLDPTNNIGGLSLGGIVFTTGAQAFTISGNAITLTGGVFNDSANAQTISLSIALSQGAHVVKTVGDITLSGVTSGGATSANLTLQKEGAGTLYLANANTYTGNTSVLAGRLLVDNTTGSGTGSGDVAVSSGATVGGSGSTGGSLSLAGGAILQPGSNGVGTLGVVGKLGLNDTSQLAFEFNPSNQTVGGGINDLVTVTGNLTLAGLLNVTATGGDFLSAEFGDSWRLFNYSGSLTLGALGLGSMPALSNGLSWQVDTTTTTGQVSLVVVPEPSVPVPEPSVPMLLAGLGIGWLVRRRRQ